MSLFNNVCWTKAQAAAGVAASQVVMTALSDISRRVGGLEERAWALPPPKPATLGPAA